MSAHSYGPSQQCTSWQKEAENCWVVLVCNRIFRFDLSRMSVCFEIKFTSLCRCNSVTLHNISPEINVPKLNGTPPEQWRISLNTIRLETMEARKTSSRRRFVASTLPLNLRSLHSFVKAFPVRFSIISFNSSLICVLYLNAAAPFN